jgi:hypothetical protein
MTGVANININTARKYFYSISSSIKPEKLANHRIWLYSGVMCITVFGVKAMQSVTASMASAHSIGENGENGWRQ